ncbi:hypothetical protein [Leptospira johnsonii]|uniref:Lipoprotein n=1 Tax=Leptospira johnsonii TaxID=1917820 RepID=A0A2P2D5J8_9LEPT|nr:hypothetical protein [Leptospira johnsonii]GBF39888.1 hypothetical protein LPTSP1_28970 [Leptospira johnsonii]
MKLIRFAAVLVLLFAASGTWAKDLCEGKKKGTVYFFDKEISRDSALPAEVSKWNFSGEMWALLCLADPVGPQEANGKKFRVVLYAKQISNPEGKYSSWSNAKQAGVFRPELSAARKEIILYFNEDFDYSGLKAKLDPGEYEFRFQAATEKGTGKLDITIDLKNEVAYLQELRKAGYVADGKISVSFE